MRRCLRPGKFRTVEGCADAQQTAPCVVRACVDTGETRAVAWH
jgi:hypothetical protein